MKAAMDTVSGHICPVFHACRLSSMGLDVRTNEEADDGMFPNVVFAAPPSGSEDYAAEVCPPSIYLHAQRMQAFPGMCHAFLKKLMTATFRFSISLMLFGIVDLQRTDPAATASSSPAGQGSSMLITRPGMQIDKTARSCWSDASFATCISPSYVCCQVQSFDCMD